MSDVTVISQTQNINVSLAQQTIDVDPITLLTIVSGSPSSSVSIINAGPQGPPGISLAMTFSQTAPATEWVVNHNFGYYPNVNVYNVGGIEIVGQILNSNQNQTRIIFTQSVAGTARLS